MLAGKKSTGPTWAVFQPSGHVLQRYMGFLYGMLHLYAGGLWYWFTVIQTGSRFIGVQHRV
jgi:hypothetical protein